MSAFFLCVRAMPCALCGAQIDKGAMAGHLDEPSILLRSNLSADVQERPLFVAHRSCIEQWQMAEEEVRSQQEWADFLARNDGTDEEWSESRVRRLMRCAEAEQAPPSVRYALVKRWRSLR